MCRQKCFRFLRKAECATQYHPSEMEENLTVRFRVGDVYKNKAIAVYFDDQLIGKKKRQVMAPGEMEQVILKKKKLEEYPETKKIMIRIEEA